MNELNLNGFSALTEEEMLAIDGGGWVKLLCTIAGTVAGGALLWSTGGLAVPIAALLGACTGYKIGDAWES